MSDHINAFVVILEEDIISDGKANATIDAIKQIKGVIEVTPMTDRKSVV